MSLKRFSLALKNSSLAHCVVKELLLSSVVLSTMQRRSVADKQRRPEGEGRLPMQVEWRAVCAVESCVISRRRDEGAAGAFQGYLVTISSAFLRTKRQQIDGRRKVIGVRVVWCSGSHSFFPPLSTVASLYFPALPRPVRACVWR